MADAKYLAWCRRQRCRMTGAMPQSHPHHNTVAPTYAPGERQPKQLPGKRGRGQKSADYYAFSLSDKAHRQFHDGKGMFDGWSEEERADWQNKMSAESRAEYEAELGAAALAPDSAPARTVVKHPEGFDTKAEIEALVQTFQPSGGQMRFELTRVLRRYREAVEKGVAF